MRLALALALAGCVATPPVPDAPLPFAGATAELGTRERQIRRAALGLGWAVAGSDPGRLTLARPGGAANAVVVLFTERDFVLQTVGDPAGVGELRASILAQSGV